MATITMYNDVNVDNAFTPAFAAVGFNTAIVSTTADTTAAWTARALPSTANWNSVCYGNKQMVAVAGGPSTKAATAIGSATATWTARVLPSNAEWQSVIYGTSNFIAIANGSTDTATSPDGVTWTSGGVMPSAAAWYCLAYGEGTFVAVSTTNSTAAASSIDNGVNWVAQTLPSAKNWQSVCYGNGVFIAISYGTTDVAISTDGLTWTTAGSMPNARNWSSITYGNPKNTANGIFLAVAYGTSIGAISTNNGSSWTEISIVPNAVINGSFTGSADGWTLGAGWTYANNMVTHANGGGVTTLIPTPALTIAATTLYEVTYTISGCTSGSVTMSIGGTNGTSRNSDGTYTEVLTSTNTTNLIFTPINTFDGSIDDVSVKLNANWNCISYGEIAAQGVKVFTVTGFGSISTLVSFDGINWFIKPISSAANWKYHCFAPITWNSGDTLSVQNNATITVNTSQNKFWKTFTATYGKLSIQNISDSIPISFYMGRVSAATANDITPLSGAFSIDIDGNWIQIGTGNGAANQAITASYTEYIPSLWVETGNGTNVYEIWNNISGATGPYMKLFGRTGLEWTGSGKRGNYFVQTPNPTFPAAHYLSLSSGATTIQSYFVTCTSTAGVYPGAQITGTNIPANTVVNQIIDGTTLELNAVCTATGSAYTFTLYNPAQSQFTTTINFGDGVNGNVIPSGAKIRQPNIMFSDVTAANLITANHQVGAYINMGNGGYIDVRTCLFGEAFVNLAQAGAVYLRNVGFAYQWALSECYSVDMDYIGNAASPTIWYYSGKWIIRDPRYGVLAPSGYTSSTSSTNVSLSYIHNAIIKHWHKVYYCPTYFTGTTILMPIDLSYSNDTIFDNIRSVALNATRIIRAFNISNRVYRSLFSNLELYGSAPLQVITSDNNTFTNIEYSIDITRPIQSFKTGMRLSEDASGNLLADNVPVFIKTRSFFSWMNRSSFFESGEYSCTPFQNNWLFPDTLSFRPTETTPASVTVNWTQREPTAATVTAYEIHRSTSQNFTDRNTSTAQFRIATPATVTYVDGPRTTIVASASPTLTFNVAKTITASVATFLTAGYAVGDIVDITGTTANNGTYTINTITATVMTVNETLVTEAAYNATATITGRSPTVNTKYYYRMRKFHSITAHIDCSIANGSSTMTTSGVGANSFDTLYAATDFYFDNGSTTIRNRKFNLFALPFYIGATITGTGIPANTTITSIDAVGKEMIISNSTTTSATNATITLPVQAGMAVALLINKPNVGLPYGTTIVSVESPISLTLSNAATADYAYVTNGTFTGSANSWTLGAGWVYGSNAVSHTGGGGTATMVPNPALNIIIGGVYTLTYTISGVSAGTVTPTLGGVAGTARSTNGTFIQAFTATTTGNLIFTPTSPFNGTIDDVSIGLTTSFLPFTESPEFVVTPHDYTSAKNFCLYSRTLTTAASWITSNCSVAAATYQSPDDSTWSTNTACAITASGTPGTLTQTVAGLSISSVYSASIWVRADQTITLPNGVAGSLTWGTVTTNFTATDGWQKINADNFTATSTSHNLVVTVNTNTQVLWATDAMVILGTTTTASVYTAAAATTIKPCAIPITTLYAYNRPSIMTGSTGNQGIHVTFGTAPTGTYYHEVYLSTTSGFTPDDSTLVARTWALSDATHFPITGSNYNNFSSITRLPYGGCSTTAAAGVFYLTGNSNNNNIVDVDIDYDYCNTTAVPALHLVSPAQDNIFHNMNFGRVSNYLAVSSLWHNTAANSVTGNRIQNIYAKHYDISLNDQSLNSKIKGITGGNSYPTGAASTFALGNSIDGIDITKTACYGSMFNEVYFGNTIGALQIVFEDTQGTKPYTTTGSPKFSNTGRLYMPTINDTITIIWPHKIRGVTSFRNVLPRLIGADFGNNANLLDGLKIEYKIDNGSWKRLTTTNLVGEGTLDATNGFDFQLKFTPFVFMRFSTQVTGTYTSHTVANPGVITIGGNPTWATGQKVLYTTTGTPLGGLTNDTIYYVTAPNGPPTTTLQLSTTLGGSGIALNSSLGTGVHTFNVLFETGDTLMGASSFATATVDEVYYDSVTTGTLVLSNVSGSWVAGEIIRTSDFKAIKATNVATNGFALGPQFSSYINALQIATNIDQSKKYDAVIVSVILNNIIPNSIYYIFNSDTNEQIATGTATGTPVGAETTIDYPVSVVYLENTNITVNVRKSSAPVKYLPYETSSVITNTGANVFISQVVDTVVIDSYGSIASDWTVDTTLKTIKHTSGTTIYTVKELYSYLLDYFDNAGFLDDQVPMAASTPTEYNLINGWFINDESFKYLTGGAISSVGWNGEIYILNFQSSGYTPAIAGDLVDKTLHDFGSTHTGKLLDYDNTARKWWVRKGTGTFANSDLISITSGTGAGTLLASSGVLTGESQFSNIFTLGSLVSSTTLDVYQNDIQITPWWTVGGGHIDILVKVKEAGIEIDSGNLTILARTYGSLYDHFVIDATSGRNPVPLAAFADGNNQTAIGTVAAYAGITFNFGYVSKDLNNTHGPQPYDCVIECNNHTIAEVYEYLKYATRSGSATVINGVEGEYYTGTGDIRFAYDNEAVGTFVQGELITASNAAYGYLVSLIDNGATGFMVLRNVHGTFTNNLAITGATNGATADVDGTVTTITPQKQAPFGTLAGGQFFGARGVWLDHVAVADTNNYQLTDSLGITQIPPSFISVSVSGLEVGDLVSVFRTTGNNKIIDKTYLHSHTTANSSSSLYWETDASTPIPSDTPASGFIRLVKTTTNVEERIAYTSWTGNIFTLSSSHSGGYDATDTAYVPFLDTTASFSTESTSFSFLENRYIYSLVRHKGIIPFDTKGQITSTGYSLAAIRTTDSIVAP